MDATISVITERISTVVLLGGLAISHYSFTYRPVSGPCDKGSAMLRYVGTYECTRNYTAPLRRRMQSLHGSCRISFNWIRVYPVLPSMYVHKTHVRYTRQRLKFQVEYDTWDAHSDFAEESGLLGCYTVPIDNTDVSRKCNAVIFKDKQVNVPSVFEA